MLEKGKPVLVAVSGGADSVALLDVLVRAGYSCIAAHCNFHLRGAESDRDEAFVRELCAHMNVPLEVQDFDTQRYAAQQKVSIEVAAPALYLVRGNRPHERVSSYRCGTSPERSG